MSKRAGTYVQCALLYENLLFVVNYCIFAFQVSPAVEPVTLGCLNLFSTSLSLVFSMVAFSQGAMVFCTFRKKSRLSAIASELHASFSAGFHVQDRRYECQISIIRVQRPSWRTHAPSDRGRSGKVEHTVIRICVVPNCQRCHYSLSAFRRSLLEVSYRNAGPQDKQMLEI